MKKRNLFFYCAILLVVGSCKTSKEVFNPTKKYTVPQLQQDYSLFRNIMEESHPGLYWYTSKDSMDYYFNRGYAQIKDSMTEVQFRSLLEYTAAKINCGHTSVSLSKKYNAYLDTALQKLFPLGLKFWGDTVIVTANINQKDSILKRGIVIKSINGILASELRDSLFHYMSIDGYSETGKFQFLSNGFTFGSWYRNLFGLTDNLDIVYYDSLGNEKQTQISEFDPFADTLKKYHVSKNPYKNMSRSARRQHRLYNARNMQIDTVGSTALMSLNTFSHGNQLRSFFRKSFKTLDEKNIQNLIIDLRSNGGGDANNSILLTKYLIDKKFKVADSLYALNRHSQYNQYIGKSFLYGLLMDIVTSKRADGKYHFGYYERHYFRPKKNHHFNGEVYLIIGGNSFSATSLFAGAVKGQKNITLVGEETGGGKYGNTAWMIPDVTLPNTGLRFRLPKFRLVVNKYWVKDGRGVMPDVEALPTALAIKNGIDFKVEKATEIIHTKSQSNHTAVKQP